MKFKKLIVPLQERTGSNTFDHNNLTLQYKLDNEFELIFVVAYQKILQLGYVDKFLSDIHLEFRDKYKNELNAVATAGRCFGTAFDFGAEHRRILADAEEWGRATAKAPKQMRSFSDSMKSKKTVASMIERKGDEKKSVKIVENKREMVVEEPEDEGIAEDLILANRRKLAEKLTKKPAKYKFFINMMIIFILIFVFTFLDRKSPKSPQMAAVGGAAEKKGKQARVWELGGNTKDLPVLDRSKDRPEDARSDFRHDDQMIGTMKGVIQDLEVESEAEDEDYSSEEEEVVPATKKGKLPQPLQRNGTAKASTSTKKSSSVFSLFKGLVGSKNLSAEDMQPALDKLRDHLIGKNVASDIAYKLCDSVAAKLEGKVLGTFETIAATIRTSITDALVQILSPKRRVDILRDCLEAKRLQHPYVMAFCGVNGVGKSTNLAKICFWLIENNLSVLIAACDTFRAGAVEQLRTHTRHLNALHPPEKHSGRNMVQLYEKGYGKDAAGIAMEAIRFANDAHIDIVLIDTAGRMQDNEPLMRALAKLIKVG